MQLPDQLKGILDGPNFAHPATVDAGGAPHVTTMWVGRDGDHLLFNTAEGRQKWHNVRRDPRVSVAVYDSQSPYQTFTIQGRVVEVSRDGAEEMIDEFARLYLDVDAYPFRAEGEVRAKIVVEAQSISGG